MKKNNAKRITALLLTLVMAMTMLAGCGSSSASSEDATSFEYLLALGNDGAVYDDLNQNPAIKYWLSKEWDADGDGEGTQISVNVIVPPSGSEQDNLNTLLATGEYPDIFDMSWCSESLSSLYDNGIILDLTDYIDQYMPNYKAWLAEHPEYESILTNDGKYICLYAVEDSQREPWCGLLYRRDWLVKYGTNPETGEAFSGGWTDDTKADWEDDVVFPSGNTDPIYISDWEWMLDIFTKAMEAEGINDGYAFQLPLRGVEFAGDMNSGFGAAMCDYLDEDGIVRNGQTGDNAKAYLECMRTWYENGWVNKDFEENVGDMFFSTDTESIYSGKVGAWLGYNSQMLDGIASEGTLTEDSCVFTAATPINDMYGDESVQGKVPTVLYQTDLVTTGIVITDKAKDKDLASLFTALDYLYSTEGGLLRQLGLSDEEQAEMQDELYIENGYTNGAYSTTVEDDGTEIYHVISDYPDRVPFSATRLVGLTVNRNIDWGYSDTKQHLYDQWTLYSGTGNILSVMTDQLTAEEADDLSLWSSMMDTYIDQEFPKFINGTYDIDSDADWQDFCAGMEEMDYTKRADMLNSILGN